VVAAADSAPWDLAQWLDYQLALHPSTIELGLERVRQVANRLGLLPVPYLTFTVAGTNGKGSCVALVAGLIDDHVRVGTYTSPHLWRYNERIVIAGAPVSDDALVAAFEAVEAARGEVSLTYFEFGTLAALWLFARAGIEAAVLEVGLGGRLDAVNVVDADVALITSIGLDHTQWLGDTRAAIGAEKAGIMRSNRPVLCGDRDPPGSLVAHAEQVGADLALIGRDFDITAAGGVWQGAGKLRGLRLPPHESVYADNLALAVAGVMAADYRPAAGDAKRACRRQAKLPGRREIVDGPVRIVYDVAHNEEAVALLVEVVRRRPASGRTHVVLGMLADKAVAAVGALLAPIADVFYPAGLDTVTPRGLDASTLANRLGHTGPVFAVPSAALAAARAAADNGDEIIVCGSFHTVAEARGSDL
jgi:dihydrofolate synthase/folylpolyglutamate synthase